MYVFTQYNQQQQKLQFIDVTQNDEGAAKRKLFPAVFAIHKVLTYEPTSIILSKQCILRRFFVFAVHV